MKQLKSNKGFSLIELMVVVAIIGILASIAVPNFQRFQRQTRQKEAQTLMSGLWKAEKAFHQQYQQYASSFDIVGFKPEGNMYYNVGWTADSAVGAPRNWMLAAYTENDGMFNTSAYCGAAANNCTVDGAVALVLADVSIPAGTGDGATFTIGAVADIGGAATDKWQLDQDKQMVNNQDGL